MALWNAEARSYFAVVPTGRSLPDHDSYAACGLCVMTDGDSFTIGDTFVYMPVIGFTIFVPDLVGDSR